jgi:iron complex transport system ATP-binding protein
VLAEGVVIAAGEPGEVLTAELIRAVWDVDATVLEHPATGRPLIAFAPADATRPAADAPAAGDRTLVGTESAGTS